MTLFYRVLFYSLIYGALAILVGHISEHILGLQQHDYGFAVPLAGLLYLADQIENKLK